MKAGDLLINMGPLEAVGSDGGVSGSVGFELVKQGVDLNIAQNGLQSNFNAQACGVGMSGTPAPEPDTPAPDTSYTADALSM